MTHAERERHHKPRPEQNLTEEEIKKRVEEDDRKRQEETEAAEQAYLRWLKEGGRGERETPQTPWLLIRYATSDLGVRPIPPGEAFWVSPDIWVESSDPFGNPVAGEPNYLHARVFNLGAFQAAPVKVDFYWANPALGLGPANMNLIGTEYVTVDTLTSVDVRCTTAWVPVVVNDGHECTMVNCSNWIADPIISPFQPTLDRHVGQRNMHVIEGSPGQKLQLTLQATNAFPFAMEAIVEARFDLLQLRQERFEGDLVTFGGLAATFPMVERNPATQLVGTFRRESEAHKASQRALAVERRSTSLESTPLFDVVEEYSGAPQVVARMRSERGALQSRGSGQFAANALAALDLYRGSERSRRLSGIPLVEFNLEPETFATVDLDIAIPGDARPGQVWVVNFSHQAGPFTAGGYTVVVNVR
jgi:hypothetical protein